MEDFKVTGALLERFLAYTGQGNDALSTSIPSSSLPSYSAINNKARIPDGLDLTSATAYLDRQDSLKEVQEIRTDGFGSWALNFSVTSPLATPYLIFSHIERRIDLPSPTQLSLTGNVVMGGNFAFSNIPPWSGYGSIFSSAIPLSFYNITSSGAKTVPLWREPAKFSITHNNIELFTWVAQEGEKNVTMMTVVDAHFGANEIKIQQTSGSGSINRNHIRAFNFTD